MGENIVGYVLGGHDNNTYMFDSIRPVVEKCPQCGYRLDFLMSNAHYKLTKTFSPAYMDIVVTPKTDLSVTYDGQTIVTKKFKEFCHQHGYAGLDFVSFLADKNHFHFLVSTELEVDAVRGGTRFDKLCPVCDSYESITRGYEYLQRQQPLPDGFYRTDLLFGSGTRKVPPSLLDVRQSSS